ncbi:MAG TPA: NTP transferase domain-containing protein, partial [Roseiarcus sp.]|nr:NTP transferase domain-containing protein [Roseiarcus sp.]
MTAQLPRLLTIVLAAGDGVRMRSGRPKALHEVAGRSMLAHLLAAILEIGDGDIAVVIGPDRDDVAAEAKRAAPSAEVFVQHERRGTAHAVLAARDAILRGYRDVLVVYADTPLLRNSTLVAMQKMLAQGVDMVALGFRPADPTGYGRLIEREGRLVAIREHKDASEEERAVRLCNAGPLALRGANALDMLDAVTPDNEQKEYYLTDLVEIAYGRGLVSCAIEADEREVMGVNDRAQLAIAEAVMQTRLREAAMLRGVTLIAPETVFLSFDTKIGRDVVIEPHVVLGKGVTIEEAAVIHS